MTLQIYLVTAGDSATPSTCVLRWHIAVFRDYCNSLRAPISSRHCRQFVTYNADDHRTPHCCNTPVRDRNGSPANYPLRGNASLI